MNKQDRPSRFRATRVLPLEVLLAAIKSEHKEIGTIVRRSDLSLSQRWERIKATVLTAAIQEFSNLERLRRFYPHPARSSRRTCPWVRATTQEGVPMTFHDKIAKMPLYMNDLMACDPVGISGSALSVVQGVYVLYNESGSPKYVGRSDDIRRRLTAHVSGGMESASLAFKLARLAIVKKTPKCSGVTRKQLAAEPEFQRAFELAKAAIRKMKVRVVEIADPIEKTIFEVYAHMELRTRFNSFETH